MARRMRADKPSTEVIAGLNPNPFVPIFRSTSLFCGIVPWSMAGVLGYWVGLGFGGQIQHHRPPKNTKLGREGFRHLVSQGHRISINPWSDQ
jgi:hypothetical protein